MFCFNPNWNIFEVNRCQNVLSENYITGKIFNWNLGVLKTNLKSYFLDLVILKPPFILCYGMKNVFPSWKLLCCFRIIQNRLTIWEEKNEPTENLSKLYSQFQISHSTYPHFWSPIPQPIPDSNRILQIN